MGRYFTSGRGSLVGHGIVYPVPIPLDPTAYRGALVVGLDPTDNRAKLYFSDGTDWTRSIFDTNITEAIERFIDDLFLNGFDEASLPDPTDPTNLRRYAFNNDRGLPGFVWDDQWNYLTDEARAAEIAEDVLAEEIQRFTSNIIEVEVGGALPGPLNFPTLGQALQYMSRFIPAVSPSNVNPGFLPFTQGTILIRSGWVAQEQVLIDGGLSLGWVNIRSEDAQVMVDEAALTGSEQFYDTTNNFPFILVRNGSTSPRIKTLFVCDPDGENRNTTGLHIRSSRYLDDLNIAEDDPPPWEHGFNGFNENARVHSGSDAFFMFKSFDNARLRCVRAEHSSRIAYIGCSALGAPQRAISVESHSLLHSFSPEHPVLGVTHARARRDADGLVDSPNDWVVQAGGRLHLVNGTIGGINQPAYEQTALGLIIDARAAQLLPFYATASALPSASLWPNRFTTTGDQGPVWSNGTSWFPLTTGSAL